MARENQLMIFLCKPKYAYNWTILVYKYQKNLAPFLMLYKHKVKTEHSQNKPSEGNMFTFL